MPVRTRFPRDVPTLTDGVVTLRAHRTDDADAVLEQCRDPLMQRWTRVPEDYTRQDAQRFLGQQVPDGWESGAEWAFAISARDGAGVERFAGTCALRDEGSRRAEVAYALHPSARGRGVMDRALRLLLPWGFDDRDLATVIWWAHVGNWASRKVAWRLGFACHGPLPQWLDVRDELRDAWVATLTASDPRTPRHPWYVPPRITGERVLLRPHRDDDVSRIVAACNDERTLRWLGRLPRPYTDADAVAYLAATQEAMATGRGVRWTVADPDTDELVGSIDLFDVQPGVDAEVGFWTHPDARSRGVMTEACRLVVRHAVLPTDDGGLGLRRVSGAAAVDNAASRHVLESCGFREYGVERQGVLVGGGRWADMARYDLLAEEVEARG